MKHYVYVLGMDGKPLMPTKRYGWVRRALRDGRAVPVKTVPFTIRLTYQPKTKEVQKVRIAPDPGRTNPGLAAVREDGKCLFRAKCTTRNKEIPKLMFKRARARMASRSGERKARKRLAKSHRTTFETPMERKLPGYQNGVVVVKDIINTEAKFNNRKREAGWLTPTARQLLQTHEQLMKLMEEILPVDSGALEYNIFDFVKMENPKVKPWEYGHGPLHGYKGDLRKAVIAVQKNRCLICGAEGIDHVHHIKPEGDRGSNTIGNCAGLCKKCHNRVHTEEGFSKILLTKKEGFNKKYHALSIINQIMGRFTDFCTDRYKEVVAIKGYDTKKYRAEHNLPKDHDIDAYVIAAITLGIEEPDRDMPPCYEIRQFRNHDRAIIKSQPYRTYYLDGKKVAQNRHPATSVERAEDGSTKNKKQIFPALDEWYEKEVAKVGEKEARRKLSRLTVKPSYRRYNDTKRVLPGAVFY